MSTPNRRADMYRPRLVCIFSNSDVQLFICKYATIKFSWVAITTNRRIATSAMWHVIYLYSYGVHACMKHHVYFMQYVVLAVINIARIQPTHGASCCRTGARWGRNESWLTGAHPPSGVVTVRTTTLYNSYYVPSWLVQLTEADRCAPTVTATSGCISVQDRSRPSTFVPF